VGAALREAASRMAAPQGRRDAEVLLARILGVSRAAVVTDRGRVLARDESARYEADITRLARGEPLAYVLREAPFLDFALEVTPDVLIPRPETELLAEWAIGRAQARAYRRAVDVGTGSGALAIAMARHVEGMSVDAVDISPGALEVADRNASRLGVRARVRLHLADLFPVAGVPDAQLVVANLPYVAESDAADVETSVRRFEPHIALFAGPDGTTQIRRLARTLPRAVPPQADIGLEIAPAQASEVLALMRVAAPNHALSVRQDLTGRDRYVVAECRGP
jgi:release factor glutamine methyltransferase